MRALPLALLISWLPAPHSRAGFFDPMSESRTTDQAEQEQYDPLSGIDPNGRIPAVDRPAALAHPDRWRYVPEGRLKPGNVFQRFLVSSFIAPYAFSSSDVGLGFGLVVTDLDFRGSRRQEFTAAMLSYTTEGQQNYELKWRRWLNHIELPSGGILQEERSFIQAEGGYLRTLTLRFYGLGPDTEDQDETSYTDGMIFADVGFDRALPRPGSNWVIHGATRLESHALSEGHVGGVPSTDQQYPLLFHLGDDQKMWWLRSGLRYDTRDSQLSPYSGWHVGALASWVPLQSKGSMGGRFTLSASKVFGVFPIFHDGGDDAEENPPTDTIAFGLWNEYSSGDLPFYSLPSLGGTEHHRGFIAGRFRDRASWLGAVEYRLWLLPRGLSFTRSIRLERIGAAVFYEAGAVAHSGSDLVASRVRHSYGVSLRLLFERTAPFRFDLGFSENNMEFSMGYGLTF